MIHTYTTLPGHDPSKVRAAPDCITASKSAALDVRLLKIAESIAVFTTVLRDQRGYSAATNRLFQDALALRAIAAEIRDAACQPLSPRTTRACREAITAANTEAALARAWRDVAPSLPTLTTAERLAIVEAFITRLCVVTQDDGR